MNILVAMETSGKIRKAFRAKGHNAWSCDFLPSDDNSAYHLQGDAFYYINHPFTKWDMLIAHPTCTYLCVSGLHWNKRIPGRAQKTEEALEDVRKLMAADIEKICVENPIGCISTRIRKPDQIIQPYQFGHDASKQTCLWLKNLPKLVPTKLIQGRPGKHGRMIWANQTPTGQNKLGPSPDRWKIRSETYDGIAMAMAEQWG